MTRHSPDVVGIVAGCVCLTMTAATVVIVGSVHAPAFALSVGAFLGLFAGATLAALWVVGWSA